METLNEEELQKLVDSINDENINNLYDEQDSEENNTEEIALPPKAKKKNDAETEITKEEINETIENITEGSEEENLYDSETIKVVMQDYNDLKEKFTELNDKYMRTMADFGNFRKRNLEENRQKIEKSKISLLKEIIALNDTFERAIKDADENQSFENLYEGVQAIKKMVDFTLEKENVQPIEIEKGDKFNPELHDCILVVPMPGTEAETIIEETEKGYILNKTIVRPAKVVVSGGSPEVVETDNPEQTDNEEPQDEISNNTQEPENTNQTEEQDETEIPVNIVK